MDPPACLLIHGRFRQPVRHETALAWEVLGWGKLLRAEIAERIAIRCEGGMDGSARASMAAFVSRYAMKPHSPGSWSVDAMLGGGGHHESWR